MPPPGAGVGGHAGRRRRSIARLEQLLRTPRTAFDRAVGTNSPGVARRLVNTAPSDAAGRVSDVRELRTEPDHADRRPAPRAAPPRSTCTAIAGVRPETGWNETALREIGIALRNRPAAPEYSARRASPRQETTRAGAGRSRSVDADLALRVDRCRTTRTAGAGGLVRPDHPVFHRRQVMRWIISVSSSRVMTRRTSSTRISASTRAPDARSVGELLQLRGGAAAQATDASVSWPALRAVARCRAAARTHYRTGTSRPWSVSSPPDRRRCHRRAGPARDLRRRRRSAPRGPHRVSLSGGCGPASNLPEAATAKRHRPGAGGARICSAAPGSGRATSSPGPCFRRSAAPSRIDSSVAGGAWL